MKSTKSTKSVKTSPFTYLGVFLIVVLVAIVGYFAYQAYLDRQNRELIEGIAVDFPDLIAGAEQAINYPLEISADCLQTQEKFSEGVSVCGLTVGLTDDDSVNVDFEQLITYLETQELGFKKGDIGANNQGYRYKYMNKQTCSFRYEAYVYLDCAFGIRKPNKQLASELFNEELLNQKKNEALNQ